VALANTLETQQFIKDGQLMRLLNKPINEAHSYYLISPSIKNNTIKATIFAEWIINACDS
jgi:LysR family glycine cleavage system transcriptional activator